MLLLIVGCNYITCPHKRYGTRSLLSQSRYRGSELLRAFVSPLPKERICLTGRCLFGMVTDWVPSHLKPWRLASSGKFEDGVAVARVVDMADLEHHFGNVVECQKHYAAGGMLGVWILKLIVESLGGRCNVDCVLARNSSC